MCVCVCVCVYCVMIYPVRNAWRVRPHGVYTSKHESWANSGPSLLSKIAYYKEQFPSLQCIQKTQTF